MTLRLSIWFTAILCLTGCGAFAAEVSRDMAPRISTDVMVQLGTEMAPANQHRSRCATSDRISRHFSNADNTI